MTRHRWFSIRPGLTFKGRKFKGLRGWAGKPLHPPLTDIPVGAYVLVAVFDLVSFIAGGDGTVGRDAYVAGTWVIIAGAIASVPTIVTGAWDWWKSTQKHTQAWRTANWHMAVMGTMSVIVVLDIVLRLGDTATSVPFGVLVLSLIVGGLVTLGGTYGGSLTYDYGFNVETSGDHPVWHESEVDVFPGHDAAIDTH